MAGRGRGARLKGANFERWLAKMMTKEVGVKFHRGLGQTRLGGKEVSDVYSDEVPQIHIEAKRQKRCNIKAAVAQATEDTKGTTKLPVVITKDDRGEVLVTMKFEDWTHLFKSWLLGRG